MRTHNFPRVANKRNNRRQYPAKEINESTLLYADVGSDNQEDMPSAVVDLDAWASVVGKGTLDHAMNILGIKRIDGQKYLSTWASITPIRWAS